MDDATKNQVKPIDDNKFAKIIADNTTRLEHEAQGLHETSLMIKEVGSTKLALQLRLTSLHIYNCIEAIKEAFIAALQYEIDQQHEQLRTVLASVLPQKSQKEPDA